MTHWYVGQEIACIETPESRPRANEPQEILPQEGDTYTIREIVPSRTRGEVRFRLNEIVNAPRLYVNEFGECWFNQCYFRPIVKTDISIFTSMLTTPPLIHEERERV